MYSFCTVQYIMWKYLLKCTSLRFITAGLFLHLLLTDLQYPTMGDLVRTGIIRPDEVGRVGGEVETDLLSSNWSVS